MRKKWKKNLDIINSFVSEDGFIVLASFLRMKNIYFQQVISDFFYLNAYKKYINLEHC
jgi:hypothetical protein